jgi:hypothetical protein
MNRRRAGGSIQAVVGYVLSPLSWWNDSFVNLPLAWLFASVVSLASRRLFVPAMILGYWLTNIIGLWLLAKGTVTVASSDDKQEDKGALKRRLVWSLAAATGYTLLVVVLSLLGILRPLSQLLRP